MKFTNYLESKENWLCLFCHSKNIQGRNQCSFCDHYQGAKPIIVNPVKHMTYSQWKSFKQFLPTDVDGEIFYFDVQMNMVNRYKIVITDHINRRRIGKMAKTPFKELLKSFPSKLTLDNLQKGIKTFDKGMDMFNQGVKDFGKAMDQMTAELGSDNKLIGKTQKANAKKNQANIKKLVGTKRNKKQDHNFIKLWSDKPKKTRRKKGSRKPKRSRDQENVEKLWGRR